jgi:hypothetical protein
MAEHQLPKMILAILQQQSSIMADHEKLLRRLEIDLEAVVSVTLKEYGEAYLDARRVLLEKEAARQAAMDKAHARSTEQLLRDNVLDIARTLHTDYSS